MDQTEKEIDIVLRAILDEEVYEEYLNPDWGFYNYDNRCRFCDSYYLKINGEKHELDCPITIARGLMTGKEIK